MTPEANISDHYNIDQNYIVRRTPYILTRQIYKTDKKT